nr:MAG TPA: hypothetical protein [Caudoviricetes sp.]
MGRPCGAACFGSRGPRVQIPPARPGNRRIKPDHGVPA